MRPKLPTSLEVQARPTLSKKSRAIKPFRTINNSKINNKSRLTPSPQQATSLELSTSPELITISKRPINQEESK